MATASGEDVQVQPHGNAKKTNSTWFIMILTETLIHTRLADKRLSLEI